MKVVSMRGQQVDMAKLAATNSQKVALGNASMNARGDKIGPGGTVLKQREELTREYHQANPKAVKQVSLKDINEEVFATPSEAVTQHKKQHQLISTEKSKRKIVDSL